MEISLLDPPAEFSSIQRVAPMSFQEGKVEKIGELASLGTMDETTMEIVDTTNNNHYMLMVNAASMLKDILPQIRVGSPPIADT